MVMVMVAINCPSLWQDFWSAIKIFWLEMAGNLLKMAGTLHLESGSRHATVHCRGVSSAGMEHVLLAHAPFLHLKRLYGSTVQPCSTLERSTRARGTLSEKKLFYPCSTVDSLKWAGNPSGHLKRMSRRAARSRACRWTA